MLKLNAFLTFVFTLFFTVNGINQYHDCSNFTIDTSYMIKNITVGYSSRRVPITTRYYFSR